MKLTEQQKALLSEVYACLHANIRTCLVRTSNHSLKTIQNTREMGWIDAEPATHDGDIYRVRLSPGPLGKKHTHELWYKGKMVTEMELTQRQGWLLNELRETNELNWGTWKLSTAPTPAKWEARLDKFVDAWERAEKASGNDYREADRERQIAFSKLQER